MAEVFVSYAREDERTANKVAEALRAAGHRAWRDDELPPHRTYAEVIEERLNSADAVVVLWSASAAKSQWVRAEADAARNRRTLVQASLDGSIPPIPFNQIQCADLNASADPTKAAGWNKLVDSIRALAASDSAAAASPTSPRRQQVSICVLPFQNMSGDPEQEYFSDGITEDITTDLSKVSVLAVTARNTAFQFKGQSLDVREVARKVGVSHVLEGSVRKAGGRVRITAQLIDGSTGDHVWAERYDRDLTDIFAIQDELSNAIVEALKLKLLPEEKRAIERRGTSSVEAYDLYLMAQNYWVTGNWGDRRQAELVARICSRAIDIDPNYSNAWGLLAIVQCILHFVHSSKDCDGLDSADRALELDENLAEAHIVKARHLHEQARTGEAIERIERALQLGPDSWEVNHEAAMIFYFQRRYEDAARCFEKATTLVDADFHSWGMLTSVYEVLGDSERVIDAGRRAVSDAERALADDPLNGAALAMGATGLAIIGEKERFYQWADRALLVDPDNMIMAYNFACVMSLRLNDHHRAMDLLERRMANVPESMLRALLVDPDLKGLRESARYKKMVHAAKTRLGFVE